MGDAGNPLYSYAERAQNNAKNSMQTIDQRRNDDLKSQFAPLQQALVSTQTQMAALLDSDPDSPTYGKPLPQHEARYNELHDQAADIIGKSRLLFHPPTPEDPHGLKYLGARVADKMHITNHLADQMRQAQGDKAAADRVAGRKKDYQNATIAAEGALPFAMTPEGQAESVKQKNALELAKYRQKPLLKNFKSPDGSQTATFDANRPEEIPNGWTLAPNETNNTRRRADYEEFKKSHPEYKGSFEEWDKNPSGVAKPLTPSVQYTNLLAKKILADGKQGPPLTKEENAQLQASKSALTVAGIARAEAFAQAAAKNNLIAATVDGQDVLVTREQGVKASNSGNPLVAGVVSSPTAHDKTTQAFAQSGLDRLKEMRSIVNAHPEVFGPAAGRTMKASVWLGSQSPEAQKFQNDAQFLAEHSTAVFGGRAASTVEAMKNIMANPNTNPEALLAGFDSDEATLNDFVNPGGRLTGPQGPGAKALNDMKGKGGQHQYAIDENGKRRKVLDPKAQLPQGWKWAD